MKKCGDKIGVMKKKKNTKRDNERFHFERRCIERIGVLLNRKEIIRKIKANELEFIKRQSNRITIWRYSFQNVNYKVIYDKSRAQVVTIYKEE